MRFCGTLVLAGSAISLLFAGCEPPVAFVKDPSPWVETAEWGKIQKVRVAMSEYRFSPQVLSFEEGQPYVLEVANEGREKHDFSAEKFFRAVALRSVHFPGAGALAAPAFTTMAIEPGGTVQLVFVAVRPGTYEMACSSSGHAERGLIGAIQIVRFIGKPG